MWFGISFVTLAASLVWRWYAKRTRWKGDSEKYDGLPYQYKFRREKYSDKLWIGIDFNPQVNCAFRRENWLDRAFKALRLTKEHQTGHSEFDQQVYFISDNATVQNLVSSSQSIADNVLKIMSSNMHGAHFRRLHGRSGCLWAEYKLKGELAADKGAPGLAALCVPALHAIAKEFLQAEKKITKPWLDPYYWIAAVFSTIAYGLLTNGVIQVFRWLDTPNAQLLPGSEIVQHALGITAISIGVLVAAAAIMLSRTSRAHMTLIEVFLAGSLGMFSTSYYALKDINFDLGAKAGKAVTSEVIAQRIQKHRRKTNKPTYYLTIKATDRTPQTEVTVSADSYAMTRMGSQINLNVHAGKLGYLWISDVQVQRPHSLNDSTTPKPSPATCC